MHTPIEAQRDQVAYLHSGNAYVTFQNQKSGGRMTFRVRQPMNTPEGEAPSVHFVSALMGPDNDLAYQYIGTLTRGEFYHGKKSAISKDAKSVKCFAWTYERIMNNTLPSCVKIWHHGICGRCGRKLTTPESIASGIGPVCATKAA